MNIQLSNRQSIALLAGSLLLAVITGGGLKFWLSARAPSTPVVSSPEAAAPDQVGTVSGLSFERSFLEVGQGLRLAEPILLQSTPKEERVVAVAAGRANPFAPITEPGSAVVRRSSQENASPPATPPSRVQTVPTVPVVATQPLPPLPSVPVLPPANMPPLPTIAVAPNPSPLLEETAAGRSSLVPTSPVDLVEISGVIQLGGRVRVIIREAGASTSRHVTVGDRLVGGQVRIKQVDLSGAEPLVVLEYNGQEFYRSIGSSTLAELS